MPGVSKEQVEKARELDLLSYLEIYEPTELVRVGPNRHTTATHDSLIISNGKWRWNSAGVGGVSALDYLIKVRGMDFVESVEILSGEKAAGARAHRQAKPQPPPQKRPFYPPKPISFGNAAAAYLQGRGVHPDIIGKCIWDGILYEARLGGKAVCVFVGKDETGKGRFACMRGISCDIKQDAPGSDKRYSFCVPAKNPAGDTLAVFESPIDAMSHASLQIRQGWDWDGHRLSLGGTSPVALFAFLERNPQIQNIELCLDNDQPGQTAAENIQKQLAADERFSRIRVDVNLPKLGKDYNEELLRHMERQQKNQRRREAAISI